MKWLAAALLVVVVLLQYRIWLSEDGVREYGDGMSPTVFWAS